MKKLLSLVLVLMLALSLIPLFGFAAEERVVIYASVPADWEAPCLWAWSDDGTNAFTAWPGGEMDKDPVNEGWYYCWVPSFATNVIVNANDGSVQTGDFKLEGKNAWITVTDPAAVEISYDAKTTGEAPAYVEKFTISAKVPADWENPCLWAWSAPDGKNAFEAWPGKAMKAGADGWYTAKAPIWVNSIIINGKAGSVQTADIEIDPADLWITVGADAAYDYLYENPDAPKAADVTVWVKAPTDWEGPCLWAWSAPDGTNAFKAWPGQALEEGENGWLKLTVPGWINSVIVNGNGGKVQTKDISVEAGKDLWLTVSGSETFELLYEAPAQ